MDKRSLVDEVAVVTGATSGIGEACARSLVAAGGKVVLTGRDQDRLSALTAELGGDACMGLALDVRSPSAAQQVVNAGRDRFGRVDSLVLSAGIGAYGGIVDHSDEFVADMIDTNIAGTIWPIRAGVSAMREAGRGGDIVIIASVAGLRGGGNEAVYASTKGAQVILAGALDRELTAEGIRVTAMCPAGTRTRFAIGYGRTPDMPALAEMLDAQDVADAVQFVLEQPRRMRTSLWSMWSMAEVG